MTDKLKEILSLCKHSVSVTVNQHRDYYETVEEYINSSWSQEVKEIGPRLMAEMTEKNTCIEVQAYPITAGGFYLTFHHDLDTALDEILNALKEAEAQ